MSLSRTVSQINGQNANFPQPRVFNVTDEGVLLGIWYRRKGSKNWNDGAS